MFLRLGKFDIKSESIICTLTDVLVTVKSLDIMGNVS